MRKNNVVFMNVASEMRSRKNRSQLNQARGFITEAKIKSAQQKQNFPFLSRMNHAFASHMQLHPLHNYAGKGAMRLALQYRNH